MMFVSLDACFRVKRYKISSVEQDPIIDNGMAFFVEEREYKEQVKKYRNQKEVRRAYYYVVNSADRVKISTCTGLSALDHADTKFSTGYDATGVGACTDARHEFMLANGVADLQVGERCDAYCSA